MTTWLRRLRGAIGMGLIWGAAWSAAAAAVMVAVLLSTGSRPDAPFPIVAAVFGFVAGVVFSGVLGLMEGRRRFDEMSVRRFATWGAVGGLLLAATFVLAVSLGGDPSFLLNFFVAGPVFAAAAAGSAAGSLALARKARDQASLEAGQGMTALGRSDGDGRGVRRHGE